MASYGFGNNNVGWKESRLVQDMEGEGKFIGLIHRNHMSKLMNHLEE